MRTLRLQAATGFARLYSPAQHTCLGPGARRRLAPLARVHAAAPAVSARVRSLLCIALPRPRSTALRAAGPRCVPAWR